MAAARSSQAPVFTLPAEVARAAEAGAKIEKFNYRAFARRNVGRLRDPRIKAIEVKGRPAVFFSREDLSGGLVGQAVDGIIGYDPDTATEIMRNILAERSH